MEKGSAILGYPQEHSSPLAADHHGICKFASDTHENYICLKSVLKMMRSKVLTRAGHSTDQPLQAPTSISSLRYRPAQEGLDEGRSENAETAKELRDILGVLDSTNTEYNASKAQKFEGSCQWLPLKQSYQDRVESDAPNRPIFLLTGPPATGKSILSSFVVDWVESLSMDTSCQYHFFISNHQIKRTVSYCLRAIAFQLATKYPVVREALFRLRDETNATFERQSSKDVWEKVFQGIILRISFEDDLFWVLDALDESDAPDSLYDMLLKINSATPIKVFVTSRNNRQMSNVLYTSTDKVAHEALEPADTLQDIRDCVTTAVRASIPQDQESRNEVIEQILTKANGSFLWVRLTLDTIRDSWHTQEDLRRAMRDVPEGMEPLYAEMLRNVLQQNPRKRDIAQAILTWAVCSYRPLSLSELRAALAPHFGDFLSLEETINQICGHFIRVTDEKVTLVHATARHFLLNQSLGFIDKQGSHQELALACLQFLSDDGWRHIFALRSIDRTIAEARNFSPHDDKYPLLSYATDHWAYHVKYSDCTSDDLWDALDVFFQGYVLAWISGLAGSSNLPTLIRTAQDLKHFTHRHAKARANTAGPPISLKIHDAQWLHSWVIDLIRIVGKFGKALLQEPSSIYRLIPAFCPSNSQISTMYGRRADLGMSVTGISSSWWDDCIARVSGVEDETLSRVLATETYFVTLVSTKGKAIVWSSETCAELHNINHEEYVTHMAINKMGTLLATAGVRTIRVWELSSGRELHSFPGNSEARTMTLVFGHSDNILMIGREDFSVRSHETSSGVIVSTFWARPQHPNNMNGPRFMVMSPDLSKVAVAERGKPVLIWDSGRSPDQQPWRCVRRTDRLREVHEQGAWTAAEVVAWLPEGTSILVLYQGSGIVHWSFIEDTQKEHSHIEGREMILTKDGNFLLTSDPSGSLYVWALPRFNLIYKLFYEEIVRDLAFSPSGQRIYDSRGALCNVWEPDVLIRHEDTGRDDTSSNHESNTESSILSDPVMSQNDSTVSQVTALVSDTEDQYYCCGRDDGSVAIHSTNDGSRVRKVYNHASTVSVVALEWSGSGKYIVSGDDAGRVICKRLETKGAGKWAVFPLFDLRLPDLVRQFLFHPAEGSLLISTASSDVLWGLCGKTKKEVCRKRWHPSVGRRWTLCPNDSSKLLWVDPHETSLFRWEDLEAHRPQSQPIEERSDDRASRPPLHHTVSNRAENVRCISTTRNGRQLIAEIVPTTGSTSSLAPRDLRVQHRPAFSSASPWTVLSHLSQHTSRLLGIFDDRVLYLDATFWVCTQELSGLGPTMKCHFFLPREWISPGSLQLVTFNRHGTVFCPRNGEVAVVRNGIRT